jgi:hypothetical protein
VLLNENECGKISRQPLHGTDYTETAGVCGIHQLLNSMITYGVRCTCKIKSRIVVARAAFNKKKAHHHHHHHHHISVMELGHLLTRSGLTYPEVSSKVCHDSFCQLGNNVSLPWVIYYGAFYLHVSNFSYFPVICPK